MARWLPRRADLDTAAHATTAALCLVFFAPALLVALALPYHEWDALSFGEWSRLIALRHHLHFPQVIDVQLQRPLFYVAQGVLWAVFGFHQWLGRLLSLLFTVLLAVAVYVAAGRLVPPGRARTLARPLALGATLAAAGVAELAAAGLTDVPVAATAAATGAVVLGRPRGPRGLALVAVLAATTVLAKPTGLFPLGGLAAAVVVAGSAARLRTVAALAGGVVLALVWEEAQALHLHESLSRVLNGGGTAGYYTQQAARVRAHVLLRGDWLGVELRLLLLFALVYALVRVLGVERRGSTLVALPLALAWSIGGPWLADGTAPPPFDRFSLLRLAAWAATIGVLAAGAVARGAAAVPRRTYTWLLVWFAPGFAAWVAERIDYLRLLSPAWAPLFLLVAAALTDAVLAHREATRAAAVAAGAALAVVLALVVLNLSQLDSLQSGALHQLVSMGPSGWADGARTEHLALGPFVYELDALRRDLGDGVVVSSDAKLRFFFPTRVVGRYPKTCDDLRGARMFVLLLDEESAAVLRSGGASPDPLAWQQCARPRLREVAERAGIFAAFTAGSPSAPAAPADCDVRPSGGSLYDAILADDLPYAAAKELLAHATAVGFATAHVERTSCDRFDVVVTGVPTQQNGILAEARAAGFTTTRIVPAQRYPTVPADVAAVPG